jgi:hypothetical protein
MHNMAWMFTEDERAALRRAGHWPPSREDLQFITTARPRRRRTLVLLLWEVR